MSKTSTAFTRQANPDRIEAALARRSSGAAGPHQNRGNRRMRTRNAVRVNLRKEMAA